MAKSNPKRPPVSTSFKPANQFGKRSKRTITELQRQINKNTKDDIFRAWDYVSGKSHEELEAIREAKTEKGLVLEMASARFYAIKYGDFSKVDKIFDRILGKSEQKLPTGDSMDIGLVFRLRKK